MATMVLSTAGASLGGAVGGSFLGMGSATLGKAVGAVAGGLIDQQVLGRGGGAVETGRVERLRLQSAAEGAPIPKLWGRMRLGGQLIWSSRFKENIDESRQGGKGGGQKVREFSYTVSFAVALCEGVINRVGRVWADGNEISLTGFQHQLYRGEEKQQPDPIIADIEGEAPAFRGVAYVVFEDFPLAAFGNRIPQLNFEVFREPRPATRNTRSEEFAPALSKLVQGVAMSPGSGEFSLETRKVRRLIGPGQTVYENVNTMAEQPDFILGLDQLADEAPECQSVALIVSWFGDDLRCGRCRVEPRVENHEKETEPSVWRVSGRVRGGARLVSYDADDRPIFGGTPSDGSVIRAIQEIKARGHKVLFYPFILMDVPPNNGKSDPWSGAGDQPVFPWRGRITLDKAPGRGGSSDKTTTAADEVADFFGQASVGDFAADGDTVEYDGPSEWSMRRFVLHYAHLCAQAGGVDSFCIGTEMRSLTQIRSSASSYPAVSQFKALANDVKGILGSKAKIGYAADWSEYFGHHPQDGSNDVFFHLDPLWSDNAIDFIGIDNYLPLADWRYREGHADEAAGSAHSLAYLKSNVEGGEGYDWFYPSQAARDAQERAPIVDTAHGEDWVYRVKDLKNWWRNRHHNRPGGVRSTQSTAWTPESKPIFFTEIGCPAVDLGANQPNVFVDPKSSESFLPYYSRGVRDDFMQRRYLQAALSYWDDDQVNPVSPAYGGRMVDLSNAFVWTWDARPWPDFPDRLTTWSDGVNHRVGHWLTGRLGAASLADVVAEICRNSGLVSFDVSDLRGVVHGYVQDDAKTARSALQPLMMAFGFDALETNGEVRFVHRDRPVSSSIDRDDLTLSRGNGANLDLQRAPEGEAPRAVRFGYIDSERDYEPGAVEAVARDAGGDRVSNTSAQLVLDSGAAQTAAERFLSAARSGREGGEISLGRRFSHLEPGDVVRLNDAPGAARYRVEALQDGWERQATLSRVESEAFAVAPRPVRRAKRTTIAPAAPVEGMLIDAPVLVEDRPALRAAAFSSPWSGAASFVRSPDGETFDEVARLGRPSVMGRLLEDLPASPPSVWSRNAGMLVRIYGGGLESRNEASVLNGANVAALRASSGEWEVIQFATAELVDVNTWRLSRLLRGQRGTEAFIDETAQAGAEFVLLNDAVGLVEGAAATRGLERDWRVGPGRKHFSHETYSAFSDNYRATGLRPFAPAHLSASRLENGDIAVSWVRRSRIDSDGWSEAEAPLGEAFERFDVVTGTRLTTVDQPSWIYSTQMQAEDGVSGPLSFSVAQVSETFGAGVAARMIFDG